LRKASGYRGVGFLREGMAGADIERQCHGVIADVWRVVARSAEAGNQGELAEASVKQAYEHRARASEREKFYITTGYFELVTEEVEKRIEALELWKRMYPRDAVARNNFAAEYNDMGKFNEGLAEAQEAVRLAPSHYTAYEALGMAYLGLNRFAEAKEVRQKQLTLNVSNHWDHSDLYAIAVVENDTAGMQREIEWAKGKTYEFVLLRTIGEKLAAEGKAQDAREAYRRAVETARRGGFAILAKNRAVDLDLMETLLGHFSKTSHETQAAPGAFVHRSALETAGHVYAMRGDARRATAIADELVKRSPTGTYVNNVWAPSIRAELEISRGNAAKAITLLQEAFPYEFGWQAQNWANYDRGRAYLQLKRGMAGSLSSVVYALSHVQLARALAISGDTAAARTAYQNFFNLWKDADPDVPILKEAKAEYAQL
jgi:tetratricopeptide (TPR) repeat protein